ncbi:hypothetical protein HPB48_016754 [Haemaphysalis longicornis]|uniref:Egal-1 winged helix domain-containing protein n=1 Tax=Haemaphysalis longicornis TaxID=44386 RepID=A0A9J6GIL3_HAELO|nr:hypothetical protein HPB48_016754 [Haemaphysalis longicornis]
MSKRRGSSNNAAVKFLKKRVQPNQGISLQELTDQLARLPPRMRTQYGSSAESLKQFLSQFPKVFVISKRGNVYVRARSRRATSTHNGTTTSHSCPEEDDVTCLTDVRGKVYRIFSVYGFISVKYPITTSVYFDVKVFENAQHRSLRTSGLQVGDCVILDAKLGPKECEARFRASRVTRAPTATPSSSPCPSLRGGNGGGKGKAVAHLVNQYGLMEKVKPNYGSIKFGPNQKERAFFHADAVDESLGTSVKNLQDVLTVGDKVRFNAKRTKKPSGKFKWEATTVSLCRSDDRSCSGESDGQQSGNEVFMSDEEYDIQDLLQAKLDEYESREEDLKESPLGCADWDAGSGEEDSSVQGNRSARDILSEWERRRKLAGERGFLYPVTEAVGTVKFGPGRGLTASAAVHVTYLEMELVDNLLWEVADGQEVCFDAVQAEDNKWIATLVWIGQRPAKPPVGDSEDIFNRITNKIFVRAKSVSKGEPGPCGDFNGEETLQNVGPGSPPAQFSISIYEDAKGIIVQTREGTATCEVREIAAPRKVDFTSECFYKDGTVFSGDLNEVLREGDLVFLDYMVGVKGKKEQTVCDLVWQGRKPSGVRKTSPEEFGNRLQIDSQDAENLLCFEDLETARAEEASRDTSRVPLDTELPEDTVLSRGTGASSSVSVTGLLAGMPAETSTLSNRMRSPGTRNEPSARESTPDLSFLPAGVDDEVLRRLARMAAAEIVAQRESLRVVLCDVGAQTIDEGPSSKPGSTLFVPAFVDVSTQTLSTGEIISKELFIS